MKTHLSIALSAVMALLVSCQPKPLTEMQRIAVSDPILPVHLTGGSTHILVTDYVPTLTEYGTVLFGGEEIASAENAVTELDLIYSAEDSRIPALVFAQGEDKVSIPALPQKQHKQGVYTTTSTENSITFTFAEEPSNPRFAFYWQNILIEEPELQNNIDGTYTFTLPADLKKEGRSFIRVYTIDDNYLYNDLLIPLQDMKPVQDVAQLTRHDDQAQILYSLMIDRFADGNAGNNRKLNTPEVLSIVDYYGGDFAGITQKIREGFFDNLGITTIWVSPITQNPYDAWGYNKFGKKAPSKYKDINGNQPSYTKFSGYHGYWPIYITKVEERFGTEEELREMLDVAHEHGMNVILDYVANHMHINSPTLQEHPDWITDSILPDGRRNFELWDEQRLTTWFDVHIPTLDLEREEVAGPMTDSALYWLANYDFDGFRHDACKHIPESYWRTLTQKMKQRFPDRHIWMIGETYGDPQLISSYVKTGMLNAQFDFNIYHKAIDVFGREGQSMRDMARVIEESQAVYGAHHTMGNISGNHDKARFISLAGGALSWDENDKAAGWSREVGVGNAEIAYRKALLLEVLNFGIPGVPCIYQGDEYAQAGANDPDNRHMMRFAGYNEQEEDFLAKVKELTDLRRNNLCLIYGDYLPLYVDDDVLCFARVYMGEKIIFAINKSDKAQHIDALNIDIEPLGYTIIK